MISRYKAKALISILFFLALMPGGATAADDTSERSLRGRIVLFVAAWCVPCHAELASLPAIRAAAAPRTILIVPLDDGWKSKEMLRAVPASEVWRPDAGRLKQLTAQLFRDNSGLPLSVMFSSAGVPCARSMKAIDAGGVRAMIRQCDTG